MTTYPLCRARRREARRVTLEELAAQRAIFEMGEAGLADLRMRGR